MPPQGWPKGAKYLEEYWSFVLGRRACGNYPTGDVATGSLTRAREGDRLRKLTRTPGALYGLPARPRGISEKGSEWDKL